MVHSHSLFYKLVSAQKTGRANLISTTDRQKAPALPASCEVVCSETTLLSSSHVPCMQQIPSVDHFLFPFRFCLLVVVTLLNLVHALLQISSFINHLRWNWLLESGVGSPMKIGLPVMHQLKPSWKVSTTSLWDMRHDVHFQSDGKAPTGKADFYGRALSRF